MRPQVDRAASRQKRRGNKARNHEPLLRLTEQTVHRKPIKPRTLEIHPLNDAQRDYDYAIHHHAITFGVGPAGTGKTWLAAMRAAQALQDGEIETIIVTRPAVEAGENLGFLPGELEEKYEPYFRPVKDAFLEFFGTGHLEYLIKAGTIEARPLAFLRGATIKNAWLIADEMQNATVTQMKMLLTRIGENAKFIINGDPTQCDLPDSSRSGLKDAVDRLQHLGNVGSVTFSTEDIVRHGLVQEIVVAYSKQETPPLVERYDVSDDKNLRTMLGAA